MFSCHFVVGGRGVCVCVYVCVYKTISCFSWLKGIYPKVYLIWVILFAIQLPSSRWNKMHSFLTILLVYGPPILLSSNSQIIPKWPEVKQVIAIGSAYVRNTLNMGARPGCWLPRYIPTNTINYKVHELYTRIRRENGCWSRGTCINVDYSGKPPRAKVDKFFL